MAGHINSLMGTKSKDRWITKAEGTQILFTRTYHHIIVQPLLYFFTQ